MTDEYLELTADEVLTLFTSTSEFVWQLQNIADSDLLFTLNPILQEVMLQALERHTALYEKITMYLEKHGIPAMKIFEYDTKIMKPKGGI